MKANFVTADDVLAYAQAWIQNRLNNALVRDVVLARIPAGMSMPFYIELANHYEQERDKNETSGDGAEVLRYESLLGGVALLLREVVNQAPGS